MAQMEVYEKSLKQAQRGLLRKAEWGKAIQPEPEVKQSTLVFNLIHSFPRGPPNGFAALGSLCFLSVRAEWKI